MTWHRGIARLATLAVGVIAVAAIASVFTVVELLTAPRPQPVGPPPLERTQGVRIVADDGVAIAGWLLATEGARDAVLLLHGLGSSRATMFARAPFLAARGYAVLAIDHRAHGESAGARITFGVDEARDAAAALRWLRGAGYARVAVVGFSLGGAAALLAEPPLAADALVLEAVHADIREAVRARIALRMGDRLADLGAPLLVRAAALRLGIDPARLDNVAASRRVGVPTLLIAGEHDRRAPAEAMRRLHAALPAAHELLVIAGADHQDFFRFDPESYARRVGAFLSATLGERRSRAD